MSITYTAEDHERYRQQEDEKAARDAEWSRERAEKASALAAWKSAGGAESDFEGEWPELRDEGRRRRVIDADKQAREMQRAHGPSRI